MKTILIADDNPKIAQILAQFIKKEGWRPVIAEDGPQTLKQMETEHPAAVLLDVMMPGMDGFEVCRKIRETSDVPVLMVTARGEDYDRIMGLDTGADDYIVKPFSGAEVMARIRAVLRRLGDDSGSRVKSSGCLTVNLDTYKASVSGQNIKLSKKEIELLWTLLSSPGRVYPREMLLDLLWGIDYSGDTRTVDSHIKRLRAKLGAVEHPDWDIATVWGVGYKFDVKTQQQAGSEKNGKAQKENGGGCIRELHQENSQEQNQ